MHKIIHFLEGKSHYYHFTGATAKAQGGQMLLRSPPLGHNSRRFEFMADSKSPFSFQSPCCLVR